MSRELTFDGWWSGQVEYYCDECHKAETFLFSDEDEAKDYKGQRKSLREDYGWLLTKVNGELKEFCCEKCRNAYVRKNTL